MIDCSKCVHDEVCANKVANDGHGGECGFFKAEQPQGEWIDEGLYAEGHSEHAYTCKNCGYQIIEKPCAIFENRFCKYCGADMRKGGAE